MRIDSLQQFVKLRRELSQEKSTLDARLRQINEALGELQTVATGPTQAVAPSSTPPSAGRGGKRFVSPEARARMAASQKARWAASKKGPAKAAPAPASTSANASGAKPKRKMSAAGRKAIAEGVRKRWAAVRAALKSKL